MGSDIIVRRGSSLQHPFLMKLITSGIVCENTEQTMKFDENYSYKFSGLKYLNKQVLEILVFK